MPDWSITIDALRFSQGVRLLEYSLQGQMILLLQRYVNRVDPRKILTERSRIMTDKDTLMKEFVESEAAKTQDAVADLEHIEREVVAEATMSTEYDDALGNEQAAAEDAETAFEFDQAKIGTAGIGEAL